MSKATHQAIPDERNASVEIYINGEFFARDEAKISVFDSGFLVGDGVWEGIRLHHDRFAFIDRHLDRILSGAAAIDLDVGMARDGLKDALRQTVDRNEMTDNVHVRLMITRGNKSTPSQSPGQCDLWAQHRHHRRAQAGRSGNQGTWDLPVHFHRSPPAPRHARSAGSTAIPSSTRSIALIQATKAGADEALMLDPTGAVATCNATNFFVVRADEVWTSTGHYNLKGITRAIVLEVSRAAGIPAFEAPFSLTERVLRRRGLRDRDLWGIDAGHRGRWKRDRERGARPDDGPPSGISTIEPWLRMLVFDLDVTRICVWSGPRTISTALMYSFRERSDTTVVDEPLYAHYLSTTGIWHPGRDEVLATQNSDGAARGSQRDPGDVADSRDLLQADGTPPGRDGLVVSGPRPQRDPHPPSRVRSGVVHKERDRGRCRHDWSSDLRAAAGSHPGGRDHSDRGRLAGASHQPDLRPQPALRRARARL